MADRNERIQIFNHTMQRCKENPRLKKAVEASKKEQKIYWEEDACGDGLEQGTKDTKVIVSRERSMEAARKYAGSKKVCVLNFASSVTPGGGVARGTSAQEESICRISTLYPAISDEKTAGEFYERHKSMILSGEMGRKNRDDCIYTPGVIVIKEDTFDCEPMPEEEWYTVDVITCAAPDQRYDGEKTYQPTDEEQYQVFKKRIELIFKVAAEQKEEVLILGAFGCGVFGNLPQVVASAFDHVVEEMGGFFDVIEFAVYDSSKYALNYRAFSQIGKQNR